MAISQSLITNLSLTTLGFITTGGIVYGSYELLRNEPKDLNELLKLKKRTLLSSSDSTDDAQWKINWEQYKKDSTPPPPPKTTKPTEGTDDSVQDPPVQKEPEVKKDIWELTDWEQQKNSDTVPQSFKDKCTEKTKEEFTGIWNTTFKQIVDYCTKETPEDI